MKKLYNLLVGALLSTSLLSSCDNFEKLNTNPDSPTTVTPEMLATKLIMSTVTPAGYTKAFVNPSILVKQIAWAEGVVDYQYNKMGRSSFERYTTLINGIKLQELATGESRNAYLALDKFVKAFTIYYASMEMGDVPYSQALQGEADNITPIYDPQKEVMKQVLNDLEEAYSLFDKSAKFGGDPIYQGDVSKWKKAVASFELKVLMSLSNVSDVPELKIKERFADIVSKKNILETNDDNYQLVFSSKKNQRYPMFHEDFRWHMYPMLSTTIVDIMKKNKDYRLFYLAEPAVSKIKEGKSANDWDAYLGVDPMQPFHMISDKYSKGEYSDLNERYKKLASGEPYITIGYADQCFILAEAVVRGWISGSADDYYKKGIEASMLFISKNTPQEYSHGRNITEEVIENFKQQPNIQLDKGAENGLEMILTQRYLALFLHAAWDSYFDYRRTGYPILPNNPNTSLNEVKEELPMRWMYPENESQFNKQNLEEALNRQFNGSDDRNKKMWILNKQ